MRWHKSVSRKSLNKFDKFEYYHESVQSPETDVRFLRRIYREHRQAEPRLLREDFCGTFQLCQEWAKLSSRNRAMGLDLDPEPLEYGRRLLKNRSSSLQDRVTAIEKNVLDVDGPRADITVAMNFSYFIFQTRNEMKKYFAAAYKALRPKGLFVLDVFGGSACSDENEEKTRYRKFTYYWHQHGFDPVTNRAKFSIHFKPHKGRKIEDVFTYDWRMWSIPELRELLVEVGFKRTHVYWEGTTRSGAGDGKFTRTEKGEECLAWVAYIAAEK
jgi:SAM-dependent methyltransferase